jgi:hypothetical protein
MTRRITGFLLLLAMAVTLAAQESKPQPGSERHGTFANVGPTYRLDFTVRELDGEKLINTRNYTMLLNSSSDRTSGRGSVKAVTKMPVVTADKSGAPTTTYINVGFDLSATLYETDAGLLLNTYTEIGGLAPTEGSNTASSNPLIRSVELNSSANLVLDKPMLLGSVDDVYSRHRFQVELLARRANK